jgi:hypothetical protein
MLFTLAGLITVAGPLPKNRFSEDIGADWKVAAVGTCEGNACGVTTITFNGTGRGYKITNRDTKKRVRVTIRWGFGFGGCLDPSDVDLNPKESRNFLSGSFCSPYKANYL